MAKIGGDDRGKEKEAEGERSGSGVVVKGA